MLLLFSIQPATALEAWHYGGDGVGLSDHEAGSEGGDGVLGGGVGDGGGAGRRVYGYWAIGW
ncbi:MAG TPA: hypothetical protein VGO92_01770, partial [Acidimicrobiales bacterium]|nr:hypothetical protein [Acidimicrobiales bacterium]